MRKISSFIAILLSFTIPLTSAFASAQSYVGSITPAGFAALTRDMTPRQLLSLVKFQFGEKEAEKVSEFLVGKKVDLDKPLPSVVWKNATTFVTDAKSTGKEITIEISKKSISVNGHTVSTQVDKSHKISTAIEVIYKALVGEVTNQPVGLLDRLISVIIPSAQAADRGMNKGEQREEVEGAAVVGGTAMLAALGFIVASTFGIIAAPAVFAAAAIMLLVCGLMLWKTNSKQLNKLNGKQDDAVYCSGDVLVFRDPSTNQITPLTSNSLSSIAPQMNGATFNGSKINFADHNFTNALHGICKNQNLVTRINDALGAIGRTAVNSLNGIHGKAWVGGKEVPATTPTSGVSAK